MAGLARLDGTHLPDSADHQLVRMAEAVAHRGPDDRELLRAGAVGLAFVRLSLVDPAGGGQPLHSTDGSVVLIANGEIYNHRDLAAELAAGTRFQTRSDCEILIHLYQRDGLRFLDRVRGMFAFVLWDRARNTLIFARDRFGVKPLYYHRNRERVVFASEIKSLFEDAGCPRELDWEGALADQTMSGATAFSEEPVNTWFRGVELVPAGTIVSFDLGTGACSSHRFWEFPRFTGDSTASETDFIRSYGELLASAVEDCGMADVEVGLFLSGGIDSAAVAALAKDKPRTFTALNGSTLANGDAEYAHRVARSLGLVNHQVVFDTEQVPTVEEWKRLVWLQETPLCGPEAYYKYELYRYVGQVAPEIKAMLLGGGSDEFNGGYTVSLSGNGDWDDLQASLGQLSERAARFRRPQLGAWWEQSDLPLLNDAALGLPSSADGPYEAMFRWKYRDIQQYNCWHEDRSAAGNGIEARVPFLDHRLVELVAAVPPALRPRLIWDKRILREALRGAVPDEVIDRPKVAFFYGEGVRHTYRTFARMVAQDGLAMLDLATSTPKAREFINVDNVRATIARLADNPSSGHVEFVLRVLNLGLLEQMAADLPGPFVRATRAPVPESVPIRDWDVDAERVRQRVLRRAPVDSGAVLSLPDGVLLLHGPDDPATWYLIIDGAIEYVIDETEHPQWLRLLRAMDGTSSLGDLLHALDCDRSTIQPLLDEAVEFGVVIATPGADAVPVGTVRQAVNG
jgi:asparagine synthase (glutamine-hydrolysing)